MRTLDLFCGMGGLSHGFKVAGFEPFGFDTNEHAVATYQANVGVGGQLDLGRTRPAGQFDVVVGGPPCRPWSPMNLQRRAVEHRDYGLVRVFDDVVASVRPSVFVLENVPLLRHDGTYKQLVSALNPTYDVVDSVVSYQDWGAATKRRRLFSIGVRRDLGPAAMDVWAAVEDAKSPAATVHDAIHRFRDVSNIPDHT
jgi:DNA (cytosine-5)-methyltransferase 1